MTDEPTEAAGRIRLALVGFGRVGRATLELALTRPWIEVVAVFAKSEDRDRERLSDSVPEAPAHLSVRTDVAAGLAETRPDVVIVATTSRLPDALAHIEQVAPSGARAIICTAEELAYVEPDDGPEARAIYDLAERDGLSIVATGVNPGFVLDLWPLVLSNLAWDVERIEARRIVDVSVFAPHTRTQLGIGHDAAAFDAGLAEGSIAGHLGFRESLRLLCHAMGRRADRITIDTEPVMAERDYDISDGTIAAGTSVGARQRAVATIDGREWITVEMLLHVALDQDGIKPIDETHLYGRHELHATLDPGSAAILSTAALLVNTIPTALAAEPGLYAPGGLPPSAPWLSGLGPLGGARQRHRREEVAYTD